MGLAIIQQIRDALGVRPDPTPSDRGASSRRVRTAALLGSLLIHLSLGVVLLHFSKPVPLKPLPSPTGDIEVEVQGEASPPAPAVLETPALHKPTQVTRSLPHLPTQPGVRKAVTNGPSGAKPGDVPHRLDLELHESIETASPGGETVHNRPGETEPRGIQKSLAQGRINAWIDDDTASRRVEKGLVDDWFAGLHKALDRGLDKRPPPPAVAPTAAADMLRKYGQAAAAYGATGNPGEAGRQAGVVGPAQGVLGPAQTFALQIDLAALNVWAIVELSYDLEGKLKESRVLNSSGNRDFNLHVLNVVAVGLPGFPELPDAGEGIHPDGTRSVWRITGQLSFDRDLRKTPAKDAWYLPLAAASALVGLGGVSFDETTGYVGYTDFTKPHMKCKVELLKVY